MRYTIVYLSLLIALSACSSPYLPNSRDLPFIHKIDVQQGNVLTQDMLAQLRPQMDQKQVQYIMGTPVIRDTFNKNRWDYIYTFEHGGGHTERRHLTLVFEDDKLHHIEGDVVPASGPMVVNVHQDRSVRVPGFRKQSLLTRLKYKIPFVEPPKEIAVDDTPTDLGDDDTNPDSAAGEAKKAAEQEVVDIFEFEEIEPTSAYADIQAAPGEGIIVPPDAPRAGQRKKGFFSRFFDSIGLGAGAEGELEDDKDEDFDPGDPRYRDITNQDDV